LPIYSRHDYLDIGARRLRITIKEIETDDELAGYHQLEEYHYRGKVLHGRRVPLIVKSEDPLLPLVLGYIELSTAFIMNRPRAELLDTIFVAEKGDIDWSTWKKAAVRKYTNLVVRIARTVISPEFRGLGLARVLVKHAARFARDHWHVGKLKPLFLEITADMLRYVPFVETAGMHYIGDTEGNIARVNKDMEYILSNYARVKTGEILREESAGIVDLQVFYATQLKEIEEVQGVPRDKLLRLLLRSPQHLSDENWALLHRIFRMPKPTFIMGLTSASEKFVKARVQALGLPAKYPVQQPLSSEPRLKSPIEIQKCSLTLTSPLIRTRSTRKIQQAFGVNRDMLSTTLFSNISFVIRPGDIVLICGPSGAGKTTLLSLIQNRLGDPDYSPEGLQGAMSIPGRATISTLSRLSSSRPLVNALGRVSFERALYSLNISGLAEAHLYVKRFRELSNGQRYRAMIAKLIASDTDIWIADEYCAALDPITANIVSRNLRRCAKRLGITCILAAANWGEFINELRPDTIVHLRAPWDYRIFAWDTFKGAFSRSISLGQNR
jgi:ABC-type ATPase with predicted acetyltransferase domain